MSLIAMQGGLMAAATGGGFTYATWNPADKSSDLTLSGGDLVATRNTGSGWRLVRATQGKTSGKWYFEITRTAGSDKAQTIYGLVAAATALTNYPGQAGNDCGTQALNTSDVNRYSGAFLGTVTGQSDVPIGGGFQIAVDAGARNVWIKTFGAAGWIGGGSPAAGTSPTFALGGAAGLFPAIGGNLGGLAATANFGASAFVGTVPSGFNPGWYV